MDKFSSNLQAHDTFCDDDGTLFFFIKRSKENFSKAALFLIEKLSNCCGKCKINKKKNCNKVSFYLKYKAKYKQQI